jgi:hypothetical protein
MGEKGNVTDAAPGLVDRGVELAQSGAGAVTGAIVGGATGAVGGVVQDRVEKKINPDDEDPQPPVTPAP